MNRGNVLELLDLFDKKTIAGINIITGLYFKRRESSVYATLLEEDKELFMFHKAWMDEIMNNAKNG